MSKVLHIQASPRTERSHSKEVADAFLAAYAEKHPDDEIETLNLFETELPPFDGLRVQAKYTILHGKEHSSEELDAWSEVEAVIEDFKSFDKYVFSVPMWNFGIPYRLKQYIDILTQPGYTFSVDENGNYEGLVTGKPVLAVYARGGSYPEGASIDFQKPYLELALGFIGFTETTSIVVQPTLGEDAEKGKTQAVAKAGELAQTF
jgi:FMN-dependent NADH-azoreductase